MILRRSRVSGVSVTGIADPLAGRRDEIRPLVPYRGQVGQAGSKGQQTGVIPVYSRPWWGTGGKALKVMKKATAQSLGLPPADNRRGAVWMAVHSLGLAT